MHIYICIYIYIHAYFFAQETVALSHIAWANPSQTAQPTQEIFVGKAWVHLKSRHTNFCTIDTVGCRFQRCYYGLGLYVAIFDLMTARNLQYLRTKSFARDAKVPAACKCRLCLILSYEYRTISIKIAVPKAALPSICSLLSTQATG